MMSVHRAINYRMPADALLGMQTYHDARRARRLLVPRCRSCAAYHWYPRSFCPFCYGADLDWQEAAGEAVIYSYSVMRRADTPYVVALVTLREGPTMMTNIVDCDVEAVKVGLPVRLTFQDAADSEPYPVFTLA